MDKINRDRAEVCVLATDGTSAPELGHLLRRPWLVELRYRGMHFNAPGTFFVVPTSFHTYCTISRASVVVSSYDNNQTTEPEEPVFGRRIEGAKKMREFTLEAGRGGT